MSYRGGVIDRWFGNKNFGFISYQNKNRVDEIYFNRRDVDSSIQIRSGLLVKFQFGRDQWLRPKAVKVVLFYQIPEPRTIPNPNPHIHLPIGTPIVHIPNPNPPYIHVPKPNTPLPESDPSPVPEYVPSPNLPFPDIPIPDKVTRPTKQKVVVVVIDGYNFAKSSHFHVDSLSRTLSEIEGKLKNDYLLKSDHSCDIQVHIPQGGKHIFFPDPVDAHRKHIIVDQMLITTLYYLDDAKKLGYEVHTTNFKLEGNSYKASAEDIKLSNKCIELCQSSLFPPYGASEEKLTATDIVVMTCDKDHLATFDELRKRFQHIAAWCVVPKGSNYVDLENWGKDTGRLIKIPVWNDNNSHLFLLNF